MKKIRFVFSTLVAVALSAALTACSDSDDPTPDPDPEPEPAPAPAPVPTEGIDVTAIYYGDYNDNGTGNFGLNFLTSGMTWDDFDETYYGPGSLVAFELNSKLSANPDLAEIAQGTYTFDADEDYAEMTFGAGTITTYDADGEQTVKAIQGGTLTVEKADNGMYVIAGKFDIGTGTDYNFNYTGYMRFLNRTGEGQMSNLTENVTLSDMTQSAVIYWGETFTETSDYCSVIIAGANYDLLQNIGSSPAINLGLNLTPGSSTIPAGVYNIINANEADDYEPFTALSGVFQSTYGGYFGAWYFTSEIEAALLTGTVTVGDNGNGNYTFTIDLADGYGHTVKGTYTGKPSVLE